MPASPRFDTHSRKKYIGNVISPLPPAPLPSGARRTSLLSTWYKKRGGAVICFPPNEGKEGAWRCLLWTMAKERHS